MREKLKLIKQQIDKAKAVKSPFAKAEMAEAVIVNAYWLLADMAQRIEKLEGVNNGKSTSE